MMAGNIPEDFLIVNTP